MTSALLYAGFVVVVCAATLLAWDHFKGPLPYIRAARGYLAAGAGLLLAVLTLGLVRRKPTKLPTKLPTKTFDDKPALELVKDAANLDLETDAAKRENEHATTDLADLDARAAERDILLGELGATDTADFD